MTEEDEKAESGFGEFASRAMRGPRRGVYEQLLAGLLIKANGTSDNLKKIQAICEAAYLSKNKEKLDMKLIEVAYTVSGCLSKAEPYMDKRNNAEYVSVPWSFQKTEENWKTYIDPWFNVALRYYPFLCGVRKRKYPLIPVFSTWDYSEERAWEDTQEATRKTDEEVKALPLPERFFIMTEVLATESFKAMKGEFENWALKQLLTVQNVIAEQVSGQIYGDVLRSMFGEEKKEEAEDSARPLD